ncbi:MAG: hypothetical protein Q7R32_05005 [Dehalococcoidia bacterium]|nr:hypothetical protein [Dehalococcoidia bacterium]
MISYKLKLEEANSRLPCSLDQEPFDLVTDFTIEGLPATLGAEPDVIEIVHRESCRS